MASPVMAPAAFLRSAEGEPAASLPGRAPRFARYSGNHVVSRDLMS